jgi:hypothetical protein
MRDASLRARRDLDRAEHSEVRAYLDGLRRVEPVLSAPSPAVAGILSDAEPTLSQVAEVLGGPEAPRWEVHIDARIDDAVPDGLDHLNLHRLLVAAAARAEERGEAAGARRWIRRAGEV